MVWKIVLQVISYCFIIFISAMHAIPQKIKSGNYCSLMPILKFK